MRYKHSDGLDISGNEAFRLNDIKYPRNWISCASPDEIAAIGLVPYEPSAAPPIDYLTASLSRGQLRRGLLALGKTAADVTALINTIPDPVDQEGARIAWEDASYYSYSDPLIAQIVAGLGLSAPDVEATWRSVAENG